MDHPSPLSQNLKILIQWKFIDDPKFNHRHHKWMTPKVHVDWSLRIYTSIGLDARVHWNIILHSNCHENFSSFFWYIQIEFSVSISTFIFDIKIWEAYYQSSFRHAIVLLYSTQWRLFPPFITKYCWKEMKFNIFFSVLSNVLFCFLELLCLRVLVLWIICGSERFIFEF